MSSNGHTSTSTDRTPTADRSRTAGHRDDGLRDILATLTHELRRPALSISGLLKILHDEAAEKLTDDQRKTLDLTRAEAERMKRLVERLGEMVKVEELAVLPERHDVGALIREVVAYHEPLRRRYGVEVDTADVCDEPVYISYFQVHEAVSNLVKNAIIHGSTDPRPRVDIACERRDGHISVRVRDNGRGIDPKQHERVFRLFARAGNDPDRPGDGLGLAVARRLITRVGGRVDLESTPGEGCAFTLTVPVDQF